MPAKLPCLARLSSDVGYLRRHRSCGAPPEVAMTGVSSGPDDPVFARYETAGVTWWLEHLRGRRAPYPVLLSRVEAGPPR